MYLEPKRFSPRYQLMVNAIKAADTTTAISVAKELVVLKVKIPSPEVSYYKKAARKLLTQLHIPIVLPIKIKTQYAY